MASVAALIPGPHQPIAQAIAVVANIGAAVLAKPPPAKGAVNQIQIGANMPAPYAIGRTYVGGNMVHDVGYGGSSNPYKSMALIWSVGGPIHSIEAFQGDFSTLAFSGGNAVGYYNNFLYLSTSLGARPQASALAGPFGAIPGWTSAAKLSGKTHALVTLKFDKKGKRFASGIPQFGAVGKWVLTYDPRLDSTYPGGSGSHRFDDETTWEWSENPALHAIAYARGRYDNGKKVFGCGFPEAAINLAAFVAHANICDANGWTVGGVIYEPGSRKDNLKYILEAGGGEPAFGAQLSVRYVAPKVALDTITAADLADGDYVVPAMRSWRDRLNGIIPKYRSEAHKWEYVQSDAVSVEDYVTEDGEEKQEERQFSLVQDMDQASQLASYALVNGREFGPIVLPCKPRLAAYLPGEALEVDIPELGLNGQLCEVVQREIDPGTSIVTLTLVSETDSKHAFALGQSGTAPPTPTITAPDVIDEIISGNSSSAPLEVADEAALLALEVEPGTLVKRTDNNLTYSYNGGTAGTIADWTPITAVGSVSSVNGAVGAVSLVAGDIPFTPTGGIAAANVQAALAELDTEKLASDDQLAAIAGLTPAADQVIYWTSPTAAAMSGLTPVARTLIGQTTQALMRTTGLGLGTAATETIGISGSTVPKNNTANIFSANQAIITASAHGGLSITQSGTGATSARVTVINAAGNVAFFGVYDTAMSLSLGGAGAFGADNNIVIFSDQNVASGGTHSIQFRVGGYNASQERMRVTTSGLDITGEMRTDTMRIDVAPTAAAVAQTHHVPVNINGTTYKLLLAS
ncbi:MAG: hypothetical protein ACXWUO_09150 [Allosphingosinicella sp.]